VRIIIAAVAAGLVLLWGGIVGLLRLVPQPERKHVLGLAAYATLVCGGMMALVLFVNYERQRESRRELQAQMDEFSGRLTALSEKLVRQLDEKAQLTASEFEIRARLQNEIKNHQRTQAELDAKSEEYRALKQTLDAELASHQKYRDQVEEQRQQRHAQEEARYAGLRESLETQQRAVQSLQKQLSAAQESMSTLGGQIAGLQKGQASLLAAASSNHDAVQSRMQSLEKKLEEALAAQAKARQDLDLMRAKIDSLYRWEKK